MSVVPGNTTARSRTGSLAEHPFERLLFDAFLAERTCALVLRKRQIKKTILIDRGSPAECISTLGHETLGQFLLGRERISGAEFKDCLSEAASRQVRIGEILLERSLLQPDELADALRQNLAYKLLECFTWTDGEFKIEPWLPEPGDAPVVDSARVVFAGISKFVPPDRVAAALGTLLERPLAASAQSRIALGDLRLSPTQEQLLRKLRQPTDPHTLFHDGDTPRDELARMLYACSLMGLVAPVDSGLAALVEPPRREAVLEEDDEEMIAIEIDTSALDESEPWSLRDEIAAEYRDHQGKSPRDLFDLPAGASADSIRARYLELCGRYAPAQFQHSALAPAAEMAAELLHVATSAYEELSGRRTEPQTEVDPRARTTPAEPPKPVEISPDPRRMAGEYARQARERMASGNFAAATGLLTLALRSDPANRTGRVELAYARFREFPDRAAESLQELEGLLQAAPKNALAHLYSAEVSHAVEDFDRASEHFRAGCALWESERA
ncbi:MAG: hypothetical protein JRH10_05320 [Deltaproteobacteria bacterium]|nr:hypothetical protein [Deltaproteobacteria bacterium]